jgi:predicted amidophosphoribosyltransferase
MLHSLLSLLAPLSCAGCFRPDIALCSRCLARLQTPLAHPSIAVATALWGVPVISGGAYRGARRRVVGAIKDGGVRRLTAALASQAMIRELAELGQRHPHLVLVPVPPSAKGFFLRGFWPTELIARALSQGAGGFPVIRSLSLGYLTLADFLAGFRHTPRARTKRLSRRWAHVGVRGMPGASQVVLVDDVMVSGATLEACARALRRKGHSILAVYVVAHVPEPRRSPLPSPREQVYSERATLTRRT